MNKITSFIVASFLALYPLQSEITPENEMIAHKISLETAKELHSRLNIEPIGVGGGMVGTIQTLSLSFRSYQILSLENARKLLIECVDTYLKKINTSSEVQPFLAEVPFTAHRVNLMFLVLEKNDHFKGANSLANFYIDNGKIVYKKYNTTTQKLEKVHEESYEEALAIVR